MTPKFLIIPQIAAVIMTGLLSGVFLGNTLDLAPAMQQLDASTYIQLQQKLNQTISNYGFALLFFGAVIFLFLSAAMAAWQSCRRMAMYWLFVALLHFVGVYWVSVITIIPLHQEMLAWNPSVPPSDWQSLRDSWVSSNGVRTLAELVCFLASLTLVVMWEKIAAPSKYVMRKPEWEKP
ncbi:MAG: DUF1772 domain-containing protein [Candidatus Thiothrix moscowensis]|nr:DUF1772 domain-containing protein [Candidatus Thiothrix moscowensis]